MAGVFFADRLQTAYNSPKIPASGGPKGKPGYSGSELISADNTLPVKVVFRWVASLKRLLWHREEAQCCTMMRMPGSLWIFHMHVVREHPRVHFVAWHRVDWHGAPQREEVGHFTP